MACRSCYKVDDRSGKDYAFFIFDSPRHFFFAERGIPALQVYGGVRMCASSNPYSNAILISNMLDISDSL
jgi:hypothetical protein